MTTTVSMIVALFQDVHQAQEAVNDLQQAGFDKDQISFAGHGASQGFLGGIKSLFAGDSMSGGGAYDDLMDKGVPEQDARYYQQEYDNGRSIVAVTGRERLREASAILSRHGGYGSPRSAARGARPGAAPAAGAAAGTAPAAGSPGVAPAAGGPESAAQSEAAREQDMQGEQHIQLQEEQLRAYTQSVETGRVGIRKEVVSEPSSIDVPVTHEEVYIERRPASGQPTGGQVGESETYEIPIHEEQITVEKQPVGSEDITLRKRQVQDTKHISDTVRKEKLRVEREGDVNIEGQSPDQEQP